MYIIIAYILYIYIYIYMGVFKYNTGGGGGGSDYHMCTEGGPVKKRLGTTGLE